MNVRPLFGVFFSTLVLILLLAQCQTVVPTVTLAPPQKPFKQLSEYGFFTGKLRDLNPNEGVLLYDLITPLFTDYAHKSRFVWMPEGQTATVDEEGVVQFPEGTAIIKNFYYPADFSKPTAQINRIETRLLVKLNGEWEAHSYVWDEEEKDAKLTLVGDLQAVHWFDEGGLGHDIEYVVPNKNQCKSCHNRNNKIQPIGPKVRNLNKSITYPDGTQANQLDRWAEVGYLENAAVKDQFAAVADWDDPHSGDLSARAMAYLDVNCAHCHSSRGPAHTTGLYLEANEKEPGHLGICKTPVAAGKGSGGRKMGIAPGLPDSSIMVFRMESLDPGVMMPEIGRVSAHPEGIALIREWVASMPTGCP